jgi:excisionase family DNA binding protein
MTTPAYALAIDEHLPTEESAAAAGELRTVLSTLFAEGGDSPRLTLRDSSGAERTLKVESKLYEYLIRLLDHFENGEGVTFVPHAKKLTTQQAADILNVSRPYLIKLLEDKQIKFELVGRHRRILAKDLFQYQQQRDAERAAILDELIADDADLY